MFLLEVIITANDDELSAKRSKSVFNPFKPEFTVVIFIQYKPRIAVAILDLYWMKMIYSGWQMKKNALLLFKQFQKKNRSKTPRCRKLGHFSAMKNDALMHREG